MGKTIRKSVTIINRNYPPIAGVTGEAAYDLAAYLETSHGVHVKIVHVDGIYSGGGAKVNDPIGEIHKVKAWYNGKKTLPRFISTFLESYSLCRKAKKISGNDTIIVMTDPPFLNYWASRLYKKRKNWVAWTMDLYPDAFVAKGLIKKGGFLYNKYKKCLMQNPPEKLITLGLLQALHVEEFYAKTFEKIVMPCGIYKDDYQMNNNYPLWKKDKTKIYFGYCGNLGEAHSVEFVEEVIRNLDPAKHVFILSVYGSKASELLQVIDEYKVVQQVKSVPRPELKHIDVHLTSLLDNWSHVCVPSKAVSAVCSGATMLFYGGEQTDNWMLLKNGSWRINPEEDLGNQVKTFLADLSQEKLLRQRNQSKDLAEKLNTQLKDAYEKIFIEFFDHRSLDDDKKFVSHCSPTIPKTES